MPQGKGAYVRFYTAIIKDVFDGQRNFRNNIDNTSQHLTTPRAKSEAVKNADQKRKNNASADDGRQITDNHHRSGNRLGRPGDSLNKRGNHIPDERKYHHQGFTDSCKKFEQAKTP